MPHMGLHLLGSASLLWWLALVLALVVGTWAYYRLLAPVGRGLRILLRVARWAALLLLLLAMLEPVLTSERASAGDPRLVLLCDRSSSMRLPGRVAETRHAEAAAALERIRARLGGRFALVPSGFATGVEVRDRSEDLYPWDPVGATALGDALEEVLLRQAESPAGAVLLLTDGIHTAGKDPALVARNLPLPVFGIVLGDTVSPPDLLLREVAAHPTAHAGEPLAMRVTLECAGLPQTGAQLSLREMQPQAGRMTRGPALVDLPVELPPGGSGEREITLEFVPPRVGLSLFEVSAEVAFPEAVTINNRRLVAVDVREKKTRVLFLEGEPDWDFSFLKRTLEADTTLSYTFLVRDREGSFRRYGAGEVPRIPRSGVELMPYAGIVLSRVQPVHLPPETVAALLDYVREGGGVLFLDAVAGDGSPEAWAAAGWTGALPLDLVPERRWGFSLSPCRVTFAGLSHEITAVDESPAITEQGWASLPPIWIREGQYTAAAGATVLLTASTAHPRREVPILALAGIGRGRVGMLAARGFWRWDFVMRSLPEGFNAAREFWRRMARWLSEPVARERFSISPTRRVFQDGEPVSFQGRLFDEAYQPLSGARLSLEIDRVASLDSVLAAEATDRPGANTPEPAASRMAELTLYPEDAPGRYAGTLAALPPGMYRYRVEAISGAAATRRNWTTSGVFWVEGMGPEFFRLASSMRTVSLLAEASGGAAAQSEGLDDLIERIPERYHRTRLVSQVELWNHWLLFAFLVALLSIEWWVRRRKGLA